MKRTALYILVVSCLCGPLVAGQKSAIKPPTPPPRAAVQNPVKPASEPPPSDSEPRARVVSYGRKDIVKLNAKLRYTMLIVLPKEERILDFTCGDKEFWIVNGTENLAYIKPAKRGSQSNLNLVTASGNIYSFHLTEVSEHPEILPDFKVFVELAEESMITAAGGTPRFVSSRAIDDYRQQIKLAKEETQQVKESAEDAIDRGITQFVSNMRFPYRFEAGKKPFFVRAMYTDNKFTYLQARPEETPVIYEIKDGMPNLINFRYDNGIYTVEKVLDQGYLAIGKQKLSFKKEDQ